MANTYLIDLGINDSTKDIVRKCNQNFRRIAMDQSKQTSGSVRREQERVDAALDDAVQRINDALDEALEQLNIAFEEKLANMLKKTIPPVGTWLYADYDPNDRWDGTTWERISEGRFLIASGNRFKDGQQYGANQIALTEAQMPSHRHQESTDDLQWTADNPPSGGPGNVAAEVVAPGYGNMGSSKFRYVAYTGYTGGGQPHNNIPLSTAVKLWHRTK